MPRIKGSHNAMQSGMLGGRSGVAGARRGRRANDELDGLRGRAGATATIGQDLQAVRNVKPLWSRFGTLLGMALGGLDMWINTLLRLLACSAR